MSTAKLRKSAAHFWANAEQSRDAIVNSPELKGPLDSGVQKVVPAYYNLDTGAATTI